MNELCDAAARGWDEEVATTLRGGENGERKIGGEESSVDVGRKSAPLPSPSARRTICNACT